MTHGTDGSTPGGLASSAGSADAEPQREAGGNVSARGQKEITSITALFEYAYSRRGKTFSITPKSLRAISQDGSGFATLVHSVTSLMPTDSLLAVPVRMLAAIDRSAAKGALRRDLVQLAALPLAVHPYVTTHDVGELYLGPIGPETEAVLVAVRERIESLANAEGERAKRRDLHTLAINAVLGLGLYAALKANWAPRRLTESLDRSVWQAGLRQSKISSVRAVIADPSLVQPLGLVSRAWEDRLGEKDEEMQVMTQEVAHAYAAQREAEARVAELEENRSRQEELLDSRQLDISRLQDDLSEERRQRRIDQSHAVDQFETLRTEMLRALKGHRDLLVNGLDALRHDRQHVTDEYVDRVIDGLDDQLGQLQQGDSRND